MNDSTNPTVWQTQWHSLKEVLGHMEAEYGSLPASTLASLITCLSAFGEDQFYFFHEGFGNNKLLPSLEYPQEHVYRTTLNQISYDIAVIQSAADQRQDGSAAMQAALATADQLAQLALNLATGAGLLDRAAAVTYFNKSANIRVLPYAPIALVGVPFTCTSNERDFLAIPHEVGHYIYRHTPGLAAELDALMPLQPEWYRLWIEEIFADVYGCLVAGPVIGLDFQDLFLGDSLADFLMDNGEHPVEATRPDLYTRTLAELQFPLAAEALSERWREALKKRGSPTSFTLFPQGQEIALADARAILEEAAEHVLERLADLRQNQNRPAYWSQDLAAGADVTSLYTAFADWLSALPVVTVPELQDLGDDVGLVVGSDEPFSVRRKGETRTWIDALKRQSRTDDSHPLPPTAWKPLFSIGGWNTKGPDGNWPP